MRDAARIDGETAAADLGYIADCAVDHDARHADARSIKRENAADDRVVEVAARVDDEHVARAAKYGS